MSQSLQAQHDHFKLTYAPNDIVKEQIDNMGEEVASDMNQIEMSIK